MSIHLRKGKQKDLPQVLELIKELARFELAPEEVEVTVDEMRKWGFGKEKLFSFFVLEAEQRIVGTAVYYYKYSTWKGKCLFLEDIIVIEGERKKGYGRLLFNAVLAVAKETEVRRMEWQVLDWNEDALAFYKTYNSLVDPSWVNCKLTYERIQSL